MRASVAGAEDRAAPIGYPEPVRAPERAIVGVTGRGSRALLVAFMAALFLWNLPYGGFLLYPFKLLATWMHELSHALVMLVSGAGVSHLEIFRDTSGRAYPEWVTGRFAAAAIASAGYLGTSLVGALLLVVSHTVRGARRVLYGLGGALAVTLAFWVDNPFGIAAVAVATGSCLLAARYLPDRPVLLFVNFVAAQACINAVLDIRVLFRPQQVVDGQVVGSSDAHRMAELTIGSHVLWATVWMLVSFVCFYLALRFILRRQRARAIAASRADGSRD
jgi:hypothetical protein